MSDTFCQPSLFYHLGVRESFSMTNNIILYCYKQDSDLQAIKVTYEQCAHPCVLLLKNVMNTGLQPWDINCHSV